MSAPVTSVIIFTNDATELSFSDGTKLELSPCGASFVCWKQPPDGQHTLTGGLRIQQRTEFTTSEFKENVRQALEFRNRFAEHPYLCQLFLLDGSVLQLFADIKEARWPDHMQSTCGQLLSNGIIQVTSLDECASLFLSQNKQEFSVEFLCKVSPKALPKKLTSRSDGRSKPDEESSESMRRPSTDLNLDIQKAAIDNPEHSSDYCCVQESPYLKTLFSDKSLARKSNVAAASNKLENMFCKDGTENHCPKIEDLIAIKHGYTWVTQHHTVDHCPECWRHPLQLAMTFVSKEGPSSASPGHRQALRELNVQEKRAKIKSGICSWKTLDCQPQPSADTVMSRLPCSLPLACRASHLHKWRKDPKDRIFSEDGTPPKQNIKVWFANGIIYRMSRSPEPAVHIYPGDGSLFKSAGVRGGYFTHIIPQGDILEERVLCVRNPPPDCLGMAYSVADVLRKASRLLQNVVQTELALISKEENCCWKVHLSRPLASPKPTVPLEESRIEGLGHFVALTNGRVRVVFDDRTTLDMEWDFKNRIGGSDSDNEAIQDSRSHGAALKRAVMIRKSCFESNFPRGACQLLLPTGQHKWVSLENPQEFDRYVTVAVEWATWVASSSEERADFYSKLQSLSSTQQEWAVRTELQKLKCFEYILDNTLHPARTAASQKPAGIGPQLSATSCDDAPAGACGETPCSRRSLYERPNSQCMTPNLVRDALRKTGSAIRTIDCVLGKP